MGKNAAWVRSRTLREDIQILGSDLELEISPYAETGLLDSIEVKIRYKSTDAIVVEGDMARTADRGD